MAARTYLELDGISKEFGGLAAINDVSFSVMSGEALGIIGPNGAGKTTLFNLISGFESLTRGAINLAGERIIGQRPDQIVRRGLARTFQTVRPFPGLTVHENLMIGGLNERLFDWSGEMRKARERAAEVASTVGLEKDLHRIASELSYGSLKLLELGRALMVEPKILLLDEPFAGVSGYESEKMLQTIQGFHGDNLTIMLIEHKLGMLMRLVSRVVVLSFGELIAEGAPEEVARNPEVRSVYLGKKGSQAIA